MKIDITCAAALKGEGSCELSFSFAMCPPAEDGADGYLASIGAGDARLCDGTIQSFFVMYKHKPVVEMTFVKVDRIPTLQEHGAWLDLLVCVQAQYAFQFEVVDVEEAILECGGRTVEGQSTLPAGDYAAILRILPRHDPQ